MPEIYHITHMDNLASIIEDGGLWSDAERIERGLVHQNVGLTEIKQSRLAERVVHCHRGTKVGEYVPFYFCPRSIMLYLLYRGNHPGLTYTGGQRPIVHLVADLDRTTEWADAQGARWAFSNRNAGAAYAEFFSDLADLDQVDWRAVRSTDFRDSVIKEGEQAEFLLYHRFPWELIDRIGVADKKIGRQVQDALNESSHNPDVETRTEWYY